MMKLPQILSFLLGLLITVYCSAQTVPVNSVDSLNFAGKDWRLRYRDENTETKILEYVTNNESINKWNQLLTLQKFSYKFPQEVTPLVFANKEAENLKTKGIKLDFSILENAPQEALVEFRISAPPEQEQDEIQRIVRTSNDQLLVLHYAIRHKDMGQEERTKVINALKQLKLSDL